MILIHSADPRLLARLCTALSSDLEVYGVVPWDEFIREAPAAVCSVVGAEYLAENSVVPRLRAFIGVNPDHPVILVTAFDASNAYLLTGVQIAELLWLRDVEHTLTPAVHRLCGGNRLTSLCTLFNAATRLPPAVREALGRACQSERPVCSVHHLAKAVGCDRRTLWRQWHHAVKPACDLRLEDMLHWLLLLRAVNAKTPHRSWDSVAAELGTGSRSLTRYARRFMGCRLSNLDSPQSRQIAEQYFRLQMECILSGPPDSGGWT